MLETINSGHKVANEELTKRNQILEDKLKFATVPRPDADAYGGRAPNVHAVAVTVSDEKKVEALQQQIKLYQALLNETTSDKVERRVKRKLVESGLHKNSPTKGHVQPQYFSYREHIHTSGGDRTQAAKKFNSMYLSAYPSSPVKLEEVTNRPRIVNLSGDDEEVEMLDAEDLI